MLVNLSSTFLYSGSAGGKPSDVPSSGELADDKRSKYALPEEDVVPPKDDLSSLERTQRREDTFSCEEAKVKFSTRVHSHMNISVVYKCFQF